MPSVGIVIPWALVGMAGGPTPAPRCFVPVELGAAMIAELDALGVMWVTLVALLAVTMFRSTTATTLLLALLPSPTEGCFGSCLRRGDIYLIKELAEAFRSSLLSLSLPATMYSRAWRREATNLGVDQVRAQLALRLTKFEGGLVIICSRLGRSAITSRSMPKIAGAIRRWGRLSAADLARPLRAGLTSSGLAPSGRSTTAAPGSLAPRPDSPRSIPRSVDRSTTTPTAWPRRRGAATLRRSLRPRRGLPLSALGSLPGQLPLPTRCSPRISAPAGGPPWPTPPLAPLSMEWHATSPADAG